MAHPSLTQARVQELFNYDPNTGIFTRRVAVKHWGVGTVVGTWGTRGYLQCNVDGHPYKLHRLAWLYVHGVWPTHQIDHINHNTSDNRISNLRDVTCAHNHQNRRHKTNSSSGHVGVTWHARDRRWQAYIEIDGVSKHLGYFVDKNAAIAARLNAEKLIHPHRPIK